MSILQKLLAYIKRLGVMCMKKQVIYLLTGILVCILWISKIVNMSEALFFPGIKKISEEQSSETISVIEDTLTAEMILLAQENDEMVVEEVEETVPANKMELNMDKLSDYNYLRSTFYTVDSSTTIGKDQLNIEDLLKLNTKLDQNVNKTKILIFHTHSQEAFADGTSIVSIGAYLAELLNQKGIQTMHHTGVYDYVDGKLDRSKAYQYATKEVEKILNENPSIEVVIDLHRDGIPDNKRLVTEINGKPTAKIMYFNGLSRTKSNGDIEYLYNPYIDENLSFSFQMQLATESMYPGLARKIYLKAYRYSLHMMPKSLLIEAGAQNNTVEEMKNAMELLANVLEEVLL